ncbi:outer membrane protein assembly factor BamD [Halopseudomonas nanhaiensis]|uniref:outer membrane protein assembly factor BamD n=1 Tax=Halopseudomonas nanhaiensis TaxID=2830842 RepID=UPI001CC0EDC5|nr:outer membrane protein assembly factor BamD [Halopseudomonas nanhaiensis]UAW97477.1 outer membrane protein assembly factor BamD [Halopseudomonas nanhaiensis]
MKRTGLLLTVLVGLSGCAATGQNDAQRSADLADVRAKLGLGGCDARLVQQTLSLKQPELEQEAAYVCLQQGELDLVDQLLSGYEQRYAAPPHRDYAAYLAALSEFMRFEAAAQDAQQRLQTGRTAHAALVGFVREYPDSQYRSEVAPRLQRILEGMARAEFELAQLEAGTGDAATAAARMRYVTRHYARTEAAKDARAWLESSPN